MPATLTVTRDPAHDVVKAEVLYQGPTGAAQLRAVAPLAMARKVCQSLAKSGQLSAQLSAKILQETADGGVSGVCGPATEKLAGAIASKAALAMISKSPGAAVATQAKAKAARRRRVLKFVALALGGGLVAAGGWIGLHKLLAMQRKAKAAKLLAAGTSPGEVAAREDASARADAEDLSLAQKITAAKKQAEGGDEDEGDGDHDVSDAEAAEMMAGLFGRGRRGASPAQVLNTAQARIDAANARRDAADAEAEADAAEAAKKAAPAKPGDDDAAPAASGASAADAAASAAVPGGPATLMVSKHLWNHGGKKHAKAGVRLAKAQKGDKKAQKEIAVIKQGAKQGHPGAQAELARMQAVHKIAQAASKRSLFERGVA